MPEDKLILKKKLRGDDGYKVFSVRIREGLLSEIDELSAKTATSRNELVSTLLEYAIQHCVVEK